MPRVSNFAEIIKISTIFIKTTFKESNKVKRIINYVLKCNLYLYFLIKHYLLISGEKNADFSRPQVVCHVVCIFFESSLGKV